MATAELTRSSPRPGRTWRWGAPALAVVVAVAVAVGTTRASPGPVPGTAVAPPADTVETVVIDASAPTVARTLAELTGASDLVARGVVVATNEGRLVGGGDPGGPAPNAVVSRVVTVRIDEVLGGRSAAPPTGATILVEEEGWLPDGRAISVNGAPPSAAGDEAVWFLSSVRDAELGGYVGVGTQGRFVLRPGNVVVGPDRDDPLSATIESAGGDALLAQLRTRPAGRQPR